MPIRLYVGDDRYRLRLALKNDLADEEISEKWQPGMDLQTVCGGMSLFAQKKAVLVDLAQVDNYELLDFVPSLPEYVTLYLLQSEGRLNAKFRKEADSITEIKTFKPWAIREIADWITTHATSQSIKIDRLACQRLAEIYTNDIATLDQHLQKLTIYTKTKTITVSDVELLSEESYDLFALTDALLAHNQRLLVKALEQLTLNDSPLPLIAGLQSLLRTYLLIADRRDAGDSPPVVAKKLNLNPWLTKRHLEKIQNLSFTELLQMSFTINQLEEEIKTGKAFDAGLQFRMRLLSICL